MDIDSLSKQVLELQSEVREHYYSVLTAWMTYLQQELAPIEICGEYDPFKGVNNATI